MKRKNCLFIYLCTFILAFQAQKANAQENLLLDSIRSNFFAPPTFNSDNETKYTYDSNNRVVKILSNTFLTEYQYDGRNQIETRTDLETSYVRRSELIMSAQGNIVSDRYFTGISSEELVLFDFDSIQRNIFDNVVTYKSYQFVNEEEILDYHSERIYDANRNVISFKRMSYDIGVLQSIFSDTSVFDDRNRLTYNVRTHINPNTSYVYRDSTVYKYDNRDRIYLETSYTTNSSYYELRSRIHYEYDSDRFTTLYEYNGSINSKRIKYYTKIPFAPYDSLLDYDIDDLGNETLRELWTFFDVSNENPEFAYTYIERREEFLEDGTLNRISQLKYMYREEEIIPDTPIEEIPFKILSNPNQAGFHFNILTENNQFDRVSIYDMQGRLVITSPTNGLTYLSIPSPAVAGTYFVQLWNGQKRVSQAMKLVVL